MPDWRPALASQLSTLKLAPAREREIIEELSQHLDEVYRERRASGASHDEAVRGALEELEERGEQRLLARSLEPLRQAAVNPAPPPGTPGDHWLRGVTRDLSYACRTVVHGGGWTVAVVLLLALGIGASTALFSATDALLFAPIAVDDPGSLVRLRWTGRNDAATEHSEYGFSRPGPDGQRVWGSFPYPVFQQLAADGASAVELFASAPYSQTNLVIDAQAELASGMGVAGNYFSVLRVRPRLGRVITREDDRPTSAPVGVISWRYFQSRFGADPAVLDKVIQANGVPLTIVGVVPPEFRGVHEPLGEPPDIFFPLALDAAMRASTGRSDESLLTTPTAWWLQVMGRLRPDATAAGVHARLDVAFQRAARAGLDEYLNSLTDEERGAAENRNLRDIPRLLVDPGRRGLYDVEQNAIASAVMLNAVVALVLLIICANVANLMLSRAIVRRKEIAVRLSLGATRGRLIGQLLIESLVLAAIGAASGLVVAWWGVGLLPEPASAVSVFHWRTFAFMAVATVLTTLLFGVVPAVRTTDVNVNSGLLESGRRTVPRRSVFARSLLVFQVALSLVLLVSAGLFLQTLVQLRRVDPGFDTRNLLLVRVMPQASGYDMPRSLALYRTLIERFQGVAGVRSVALTQPALLSGSVSTTSFYLAGQPVPADPRDREGREIHRVVVSPEFFRVLGIPILRGRGITPGDHSDAPRVAVINEAAARRFVPGEDPIGQRFGTSPDRTGGIEIVGLARDAKYSEVREPAPPTMYVSYLQAPRAAAVFVLRTHGMAEAVAGSVRDVVRRVDPNLPLVSVMTQHQAIERHLAQERLFAQACSLFGGIALLLASVGLFGLMSYSVARRTGEMGVRMALGAQRRSVVQMIMVESMGLVGIGLVAGLALTAVATRLIATLLFGVPPHHPGTILAAAALLVIVCGIAAYLPARRASLVDPLVALRCE